MVKFLRKEVEERKALNNINFCFKADKDFLTEVTAATNKTGICIRIRLDKDGEQTYDEIFINSDHKSLIEKFGKLSLDEKWEIKLSNSGTEYFLLKPGLRGLSLFQL